MNSKEIPISAAKNISKKYGWDQVFIYARKIGDSDGDEHLTTYGKNKENCEAAALIGDHLKYKVFGWEKDEFS